MDTVSYFVEMSKDCHNVIKEHFEEFDTSNYKLESVLFFSAFITETLNDLNLNKN